MFHSNKFLTGTFGELLSFREFDETVEALQRDLTVLEKENADLKERSRHMCKKTLLMVVWRLIFFYTGSPF